MSPTPRSICVIALAACAVSLTTARAAWTESFWTQTNAGTYDWFTAGNWSNNTVPNGTNYAAMFSMTGYVIAGNVTNTVNSNISLGALRAINTGTGSLTLNGSGTITLDGSQFGGATILQASSVNETIENNLVLANPSGANIYGTAALWLKGNVTGSGPITLGGKVYLGGDNSFSGNVTLTTGAEFIATSTNTFEHANAGTYFWQPTISANIGTEASGTTTFGNAINLSNTTGTVKFFSGGSNSTLDITTSSWANAGGTGNIQITRAATNSLTGFTNTGVGTVKFSGTDFTISKNIQGQGFGNGSVLELSPASGTQTWSGNISSFASGERIVKSGSGTVVLSGTNNTYVSKTLVNAGVLLVNGTHVQASAGEGGGSALTGLYEVASGGTLGGTGRISGYATSANSAMVLAKSGGFVAPGASIGTLTLDGTNISGSGSSVLNMASGATFKFELAGDGTTADQIAFWNYVNGDFKLNSNAIDLTLLGAQVGGTYTVSLFKFYSDSGTTLTGSGITTGLTTNGITGAGITNISLNYNGGGNTIDLTYEVVPEPSTIALLGLGGIALAAYRLRRRNIGKG